MQNLDLLIPKVIPTVDRFAWATVTEVDPIRIRLDGETEPLDITPDCLIDVGWVDVDRRVWVQISGRRVVILGQSGKGTFATPDTLTIASEGWIKSQSGDFELNGDGTGQWPLMETAVSANRAQAVAQTYATGATVQISDLSNALDPDVGCTYDSGGITISRGGVFVAAGTIVWGTNGVGMRYAGITRMSETLQQAAYQAGTSITTRVNVSWTGRLEAGERISLIGYQSSGGNLATTPNGTRLGLSRIAA